MTSSSRFCPQQLNTYAQTPMHTSHHTPRHVQNTLIQPDATRSPVCVLQAVGRTPEAVCWAHRAPALKDVINQFRERWVQKQEESCRETGPIGALPQTASTLLIQEGLNSSRPGAQMPVYVFSKKKKHGKLMHKNPISDVMPCLKKKLLK